MYIGFYAEAGGANLLQRPVTYLIKYILQFVLCQGAALDVLDRTEGPCHCFSVCLCDRRHLLLRQFFLDLIVVAQINLCANNEAGDTRAVMMDFGKPLLLDVFEGSWRCHGEADKEDVRLGVR